MSRNRADRTESPPMEHRLRRVLTAAALGAASAGLLVPQPVRAGELALAAQEPGGAAAERADAEFLFALPAPRSSPTMLRAYAPRQRSWPVRAYLKAIEQAITVGEAERLIGIDRSHGAASDVAEAQNRPARSRRGTGLGLRQPN